MFQLYCEQGDGQCFTAGSRYVVDDGGYFADDRADIHHFSSVTRPVDTSGLNGKFYLSEAVFCAVFPEMKVGDWVRVIKEPPSDAHAHMSPLWTGAMDRMCGRRYQIHRLSPSRHFPVIGEQAFHFHPSWLVWLGEEGEDGADVSDVAASLSPEPPNDSDYEAAIRELDVLLRKENHHD